MFSSKASLSVHHERRHGIKVAKKKCFVCAEILDAQDVKQHILNAHPGALPEDDVTREETKVDEDNLGKCRVGFTKRKSNLLDELCHRGADSVQHGSNATLRARVKVRQMRPAEIEGVLEMS